MTTPDEARRIADNYERTVGFLEIPTALRDLASQVERLEDQLLVERGMNELHRQTVERLNAEKCVQASARTEWMHRAKAAETERDRLRAALLEERLHHQNSVSDHAWHSQRVARIDAALTPEAPKSS